MEIGIPFSKVVKKTKHETRTMNSVLQCCRKTENKNESCISFFDAKEKRLALRYTHSLAQDIGQALLVL